MATAQDALELYLPTARATDMMAEEEEEEEVPEEEAGSRRGRRWVRASYGGLPDSARARRRRRRRRATRPSGPAAASTPYNIPHALARQPLTELLGQKASTPALLSTRSQSCLPLWSCNWIR